MLPKPWLRTELPFVATDGLPESVAEVEGLLPEFLRAHNVLPLSTADGQLAVIMAAPQDPFVIKALRLTTGMDEPRVGVASDIEKVLSRLSSESETQAEGEAESDGVAGDFVEHLRDLASEAPVIRHVNAIIGKVIELRASDIHLEPLMTACMCATAWTACCCPAKSCPRGRARPSARASSCWRTWTSPSAACRKTVASTSASRAAS